jgi:flavin-dependent dehydrogenase
VLDGSFQVVGFARENGGVAVEVRGPHGATTLRARLLVGADGSSSTVARVLRGAPPPREDRIVAVRAYFEDVKGPHDTLDLYFTGDSFPGYYWLFPTGRGTANVGLGMALETVPAHVETLRPLLLRLIERDKALARRLEDARLVGKIIGWPLMTYDPKLPIVGDNVMLVGDAAGLINPLNGEGIQYALLSGGWAAETAARCAERGDFTASVLAPYCARVERELRYDMALARVIIQFISNRALNPVWLEALWIITARARHDDEYARVAGGILAGIVPAREAISLRIIGATLEQAALSLGVSAALTAAAGPFRWGGLGIETAQVGFQFAYDAARDPAAFASWIARVADSAVELAAQAGWDALAPPPAASTAVRVVA